MTDRSAASLTDKAPLNNEQVGDSAVRSAAQAAYTRGAVPMPGAEATGSSLLPSASVNRDSITFGPTVESGAAGNPGGADQPILPAGSYSGAAKPQSEGGGTTLKTGNHSYFFNTDELAYGSKVVQFEMDGNGYVLSKNADGSQTFHQVGDNNQIGQDTHISAASMAPDGTVLLQHADTNTLEIRTPDDKVITVPGATGMVTRDGSVDITRADGTQEIRHNDGTVIETDNQGRPSEITGKNGTQRQLNRAPDGSLSSVTDSQGNALLQRNSDGTWKTSDGQQVTNVQVGWQGIVSYKDSDGNLQNMWPDGGTNSATNKQLSGLNFYPDNPQARQAEEQQLQNWEQNSGQVNQTGQKIVTELHNQGVSSVDIWHGSNIVVQGDGGALYDQWKQMGAESRGSSHYSNGQQYQIPTGPGDGVILFGKTANGDTWFQFERHADASVPAQAWGEVTNFLGIGQKVAHDRDADLYKSVQQGIGPLGITPYGDSNPVIINYRKTDG